MNSPHNSNGRHSNRIDAYRDDLLEAGERIAFERRIAEDVELERSLMFQDEVDAALRRLYAPPEKQAIQRVFTVGFEAARTRAALGPEADSADAETPPAPFRVFGFPRMLALAAAIAMLLFGGWLFSTTLDGPASEYEWQSLESAYAMYTGRNMTPDWVCENDEELASSFSDRFGQSLLLRDPPDDLQTLGLAYCNTITERTVCLLVRKGGVDVVVFVDRVEPDSGQRIPDGSKLNLHQRTIGRLVAYEVSPFEQPAVLDLLYDPEDTDTG